MDRERYCFLLIIRLRDTIGCLCCDQMIATLLETKIGDDFGASMNPVRQLKS